MLGAWQDSCRWRWEKSGESKQNELLEIEHDIGRRVRIEKPKLGSNRAMKSGRIGTVSPEYMKPETSKDKVPRSVFMSHHNCHNCSLSTLSALTGNFNLICRCNDPITKQTPAMQISSALRLLDKRRSGEVQPQRQVWPSTPSRLRPVSSNLVLCFQD